MRARDGDGQVGGEGREGAGAGAGSRAPRAPLPAASQARPRGSWPTRAGPFAAVPGALVHLGPRLQLELVPGEEERAVHVRVRGGPDCRRRPQPHLHLPQVGRQAGPSPPRGHGLGTAPGLTPDPFRGLPPGKSSVRRGPCCCGRQEPRAATATPAPVSGAPSSAPCVQLPPGDPPAPALQRAGWWPLHGSLLAHGLAWTCPGSGRGSTNPLGHWVLFGADLQAPPCPQ